VERAGNTLVNRPLTANPAILFDGHSHGWFEAVKRGDEAREALRLPTSNPACRTLPTDAATSRLVGRTVADVERDLILDTLDHCLGNRTQAARILGISIRTLRNKLNEYGSAGLAIPQPGQARVALA
jgi:two-component system, response regulator FlrC